MKKYIAVAKNEWSRMITYRFTIFSYRIASFIEISVQIVIWSTIYKSTENVFGYNFSEMLTYIVMGYLFSFLMANYNYESRISRSIQYGEISSILCQPISWFAHTVSTALGRLYITLISSLFFQTILIIILHKFIILPKSFTAVFLIIAIVIIGFFIKLFLSMLIGLISFWTINVSGIQYSARVLIGFFSGSYFTLALLPASVLKISLLLPFAYTFYVPAQIYLGKMSLAQGFRGLLISLAWLLVLYLIIKIVWTRGLKKYEAVGI